MVSGSNEQGHAPFKVSVDVISHHALRQSRSAGLLPRKNGLDGAIDHRVVLVDLLEAPLNSGGDMLPGVDVTERQLTFASQNHWL
jgi:hypothetical protein